ncbi:MAG: hypothetical protein P8Z40_01660 [Chloroflexota bacterium]|jgi:hypothetical protein
MSALSEYLVPYVVSNCVAVLLLIVAYLWPKVARWLFVGIFIAAGLFNVYTAITQPEAYLMFGGTALLRLYRDFIYGAFSQYTTLFILLIALGQLSVGVLLSRPDPLLRLGVIGACIFLAAIAPLGVGSAFPFSLIAIAALIVMYRKLRAENI